MALNKLSPIMFRVCTSGGEKSTTRILFRTRLHSPPHHLPFSTPPTAHRYFSTAPGKTTTTAPLGSIFENANNAAGGAGASSSSSAKPRAVGHAAAQGKKNASTWVMAAVGGMSMFGAYIAYKNDFSFTKMMEGATTATSAIMERQVGDPLVEDLQKALGPPPPEGYATILIAIEDVLVKRTYHRRFGWVYEPREGAKELLRSLVDPSMPVFVTLWSENSVAVGNEVMEKFAQEIGGPSAHTQPLGVEHMFLREGGIKEKRLEYFARDPATILLIDHNHLSEELNPNNTVLVESMSSKDKERQETTTAAGATSSSSSSSSSSQQPADTTCLGIKALIQRVREDAQGAGGVNVPYTLEKLRHEAKVAGFSTDTQGIYQYLIRAAEKEAEIERQRREGGLGGYLRRFASSSVLWRGKPTTTEASLFRPFRYPGEDTDEDAILATKFREIASKMFAGAPGGGR